jgi:opacity protein-like surface antigen
MSSRFPAIAAVLLLACAADARAQQPAPPPSPISRVDVSGTLGWFNANKSDLEPAPNNDWYNRSLHGGVSVGWYWTDHLKTEIEAGATTTATLRNYPRVVFDGQPTNASVESSFRTRKLAVSQQYQAYRNEWAHPYVAAGVETTWERVTESYGPLYLYDSVARTSRLVAPPRTEGPETRVVVRPFGAVGVKAYMTPHSFFKTELRMSARRGVDEVLLRFGFGVDF